MLLLNRPHYRLSRIPFWLIAALVLACGGAESQNASPESPPVHEASSETNKTKETTPPATASGAATGVPLIEEGAQKVPISETTAGPARYPEDAPKCDGCTETRTWLDETGRTHRTWSSESSGESIQKSMLDELKTQGWSIRSDLRQSGQFALDATKGSQRIAVLIAGDEETGKSLISAIITP